MKFDAIIIGAGPAGMQKALQLQKSGKDCVIVAKGHSLHGYDDTEFIKAGGMVLMGDTVLSGKVEDGKVLSITTANLGEVTLEADNYYLASGKYFSGGLCASYDSISEPIFGIDVDFDADRSKWFDRDFSAHQNFLDFGVKASADGCALLGGRPVTNLHPIGEILSNRQ